MAAAAVAPPFVVAAVAAAVATFVAEAALLSAAFECKRFAVEGPSSATFLAAGLSGVSEWEAEVRGWPSIDASPWGSSG